MRIAMLGLVLAASASAASQQSSSPTTSTGIVLRDFRPGQTFRDCPECPEMVVTPSGSFMMGSPPNEPGRFYGEDPLRRVNVRQFAAGKFDVTRGEWAAFAKATNRPAREGCEYSGFPKEQAAKASWRNLGFPQDDSHPVVCVSRMGICRACGNHDALSVGFNREPRVRELWHREMLR